MSRVHFCPRLPGTMKTQAVALVALSTTFAACGAVSGDVAATGDLSKTVGALAGSKVYLVPATIENVTELAKRCDLADEWYNRSRGEHARLIAMRALHADSAAASAKRSPEVARRHLHAASLYADSLSHLPVAPPTDPDSLVTRMSTRSTTLDRHGHYAFSRIPPGQYFVVTPGVGWTGTVVGRLPVRLDIRLSRLESACAALGKTESLR